MKKYFITGLIILLPAAVTLALFVFIVKFLTTPFSAPVESFLSGMQIAEHGWLFLSREQVIQLITQVFILFGLFFITAGLGLIARLFFFKWLFRLGDAILHRIPLINKVYKTAQEVIRHLFSSDSKSFTRVVMVPFLYGNAYSLGLVVKDAPVRCNAAVSKDLVTVFIATTPNPTSGFLALYERKDLVFLDMPVEEAVKYIVSCGVISMPSDAKVVEDK